MKGVVRPHAMPTRRKPRVHRKMEGDGVAAGSPSAVLVDIVRAGLNGLNVTARGIQGIVSG